MLKITGELLNMTQVESGSIQMNIMPTDTKEIVEYAVNANKSAAEQKQIQFKIGIPENLPKLFDFLTNLFENHRGSKCLKRNFVNRN